MTRKTYTQRVAADKPSTDGSLNHLNLIHKVYRDMPWLPPEDIRHALDSLFGTIQDGLEAGKDVKLDRFGTFELEWIPPTERWVAIRRRTESFPGYVAIRFYQSDVWWRREGFEPPSLFEKRLRDKRKRRTNEHFAKKKPR